MEISREYFEKYLSSSQPGLLFTLKEKDSIRKRNRAKTILSMQDHNEILDFKKGDVIFKVGEEGDAVYLTEKGSVKMLVKTGGDVFEAKPGNLFGEHSLLTGRPRNTTAVCNSDDGCTVHMIHATDFRKLMSESPHIKESLMELSQRRDFKKAVVLRLGKEFPYDNPREAFDATDVKKQGFLDEEDIAKLMRDMDPEFTDEEVRNLIKSLDFTNSGAVSFEEFTKAFIANIRTSASI
jgi:hypothetical protein